MTDSPNGSQPDSAPLELFSAADIAQIAGVSRQRISQLVQARQFPPPDAVCGPREFWLRPTVEAYVAAFQVLPVCLVCGAEYPGTHRNARFPMCPAHVGMYAQIKIAIDSYTHQTHRQAVARWHGGQEEPTYDTGSWPHRQAKRWLQEGSQMHRLCIEAHEKGWPLWARLPAEIQAWVQAHPTVDSRVTVQQ